jgi:hypothetical protein
MNLKQSIKEKIILGSLKKKNKEHPFSEDYAENYQLEAGATKFDTNSYYFSGHNADGTSIYTRLALRGDSTAEVWFVYRDILGNLYYNTITKCNIVDSPLTVVCIETSKIWKVHFAGVLHSKYVDSSKTNVDVNVTADLTFTANSNIFDFEYHLNPKILATALAKEKWDKTFRENNALNKQTHYEQQGLIDLKITLGESITTLHYIGMKDHSFGRREWGYMDKHIWLMVLLNEGESLNLNMVNYPHMKLKTGYYVKDNKTIGIIEATDFSALDGNGECLNSFVYYVKLESGAVFNVTAELESSLSFNFEGTYTIHEGLGTFIINGNKYRGIIEYGYNSDTKRWGN